MPAQAPPDVPAQAASDVPAQAAAEMPAQAAPEVPAQPASDGTAGPAVSDTSAGADTGTSTDEPAADEQPEQPTTSPTDGPAGPGRPGDSPWAYPPQRSSASTDQDAASPSAAQPASASTPGTRTPGAGGPTTGTPGTGGPATGMPEAGVPGAPAPASGTPTAGTPGSGVPGTPLPGTASAAQPWPGVPGQQLPPPPVPGDAAPPAPSAPATPPGPYPPSPGWYTPPWQQAGASVPPAPPAQPYPPAVAAVPPGYPTADTPEPPAPPTAEDFARRRQVRPPDPVATIGVRAMANKIGLRLPPGRHEQELKRDIEMVRRNFGGLRQVTVVNPKGGAGKTVAILLLAMTFGQKRGGYVLAWDNNETQGTLGMRAQQDFHSRTVRDLLRDLGQFHGAHGRVGDLSQYVRSQGEGMFDVLASDESATGGEMLTAAAFAELREVVSRFYKLIFVDTGNNVRAQNWQAAMDATDQLVVTMSARNDSAETAARMLDHLEQSGRQRLVRQAVTVVSMPPSRKEIDLPAIQEHFAARTRAVLLAPYERLIDSGEPIRYGALSSATREAWLKIAASVAEGL
ncbi:chromosome partitioning protein [Micromonospora costi]|uniref:chromosome partitioning protein n=1 Tax=Micromonospora costi TaxID=1530042 RepID=UPI0035E89002